MVSTTLDGVRIVDFTRILSGPYGTMLLADMGAEVIKVEPPVGDPIRRVGPPFEPDGRSPYFMAINRNKKSVVVDLTSERGQELIKKLVRTADVVVSNFRPGVMDRLGLGRSSLREIKPDLVICDISSYGSDGPYAHRPAYDLIIQAMSGGMSITGVPGQAPVRAGIAMGDLAGGTFAALAICAALFRRERTGKGEDIDISLMDVQVSLLTYVAQYYFTDGVVPGAAGSAHPTVVPYQAFATADGYIVVAVFGEHFWKPLCEALDILHLATEYPDNLTRHRNRDAVNAGIQEALRTRTTDEWVERLVSAGVPCGPINTLDRVASDEQLLHRNMIVHDGERPLLGNPIKTGEPDRFMRAPNLGEHTEDIFGAIDP